MNSKPSTGRLRFSIVAVLALITVGFADDKASPGGDKPRDLQTIQSEIEQLREAHGKLRDEVAKLREENAQLRKENQALRLLLAEKINTGAGAASTNAATNILTQTNSPTPAAVNALTNWLTSASGKRHNSRCRYFKATSGRFCSPDEGQPCKLCGG